MGLNGGKIAFFNEFIEARLGEQLLNLVYKATSIVGKKKKISVKEMKKKLKLSKKKVGQLAGLLTEEGVFEVRGLKGPLLKFLGNGISVAFLVVTWSQLYAVNAYGLTEILSLVSTGFSVALLFGVVLQVRISGKLKKNKAKIEASGSLRSPPSPPSAPSPSLKEPIPKASDSPDSDASRSWTGSQSRQNPSLHCHRSRSRNHHRFSKAIGNLQITTNGITDISHLACRR